MQLAHQHAQVDDRRSQAVQLSVPMEALHPRGLVTMSNLGVLHLTIFRIFDIIDIPLLALLIIVIILIGKHFFECSIAQHTTPD
jgi:hypothetical protein